MEVEYVDERNAELMIDTNYEKNIQPSKKLCVQEEVFRPVLPPQPHRIREKPVAICDDPMEPINRPIEKISFATVEDYLSYKQQHCH